MFYEPKKNDHGLSKNPFKSCTVPRVIGWISTKNEDGSDNLAPYPRFLAIPTSCRRFAACNLN